MYHLTSDIVAAKTIRCTLSTSVTDPIVSPVICFSLQAPARMIAGGEKIDGLGGFTAIRLDGTLSPTSPIQFEVAFADPYFHISNRAWHPQGPYLRHPDGSFPLVDMDITLGVKSGPAPAPQMPKTGLALIPAPQDWRADGWTLPITGLAPKGAFGDVVMAANAWCTRRNLPGFGAGVTVQISQEITVLPEGYRLRIADDIALAASDAGGAFYGLITLATLRNTYADILPRGTITDAPRFGWRGFMLDCAREFYPVDAILKLLDLLALLKMNRFHWHFADDEAFRIAVKTAPDLWEKSCWRGEGQTIPGVFGGQPGPRGGSYSRADIAKVVAHAEALNIAVLPEIEVPAHALALTAIRADLRDPNDTGTEESVQGYKRNVVNPAQQATWDLLEPLSLEVASLFPFGHIHLGGDELPDRTWEGSPLVDAYKFMYGLKTHQDVQGHIMQRLASHLASAGYQPCAWQEAADGCTGGIGNDAILFSWTGAGPGRAAARKGYRVVMCPAQHTYFDMAHSADPDDWGANWAATYALDCAFNWDVVPAPDIADKIIGVEGTFWSEFTSDAADYEPMIAPRIFALATKGWSAADGTTLSDLRASVTCYIPLMQRFGWAMHYDAIFADTPPGNIRRVDA